MHLVYIREPTVSPAVAFAWALPVVLFYPHLLLRSQYLFTSFWENSYLREYVRYPVRRSERACRRVPGGPPPKRRSVCQGEEASWQSNTHSPEGGHP